MGFFSFLLLVGLVLATLWRVQQLQGDVAALKAQNDFIIRALKETAGETNLTPDIEGEEIL